MAKTRKNHKNLKHIPALASTFRGLQDWHKTMFEKLGMMVIAKAKGYDYKIAAYKKGLKHLKESIEHVMREYTNANTKHDLKVLHMHLMVLIDHVNKDF
jgi:hypothetical protein